MGPGMVRRVTQNPILQHFPNPRWIPYPSPLDIYIPCAQKKPTANPWSKSPCKFSPPRGKENIPFNVCAITMENVARSPEPSKISRKKIPLTHKFHQNSVTAGLAALYARRPQPGRRYPPIPCTRLPPRRGWARARAFERARPRSPRRLLFPGA